MSPGDLNEQERKLPLGAAQTTPIFSLYYPVQLNAVCVKPDWSKVVCCLSCPFNWKFQITTCLTSHIIRLKSVGKVSLWQYLVVTKFPSTHTNNHHILPQVQSCHQERLSIINVNFKVLSQCNTARLESLKSWWNIDMCRHTLEFFNVLPR